MAKKAEDYYADLAKVKPSPAGIQAITRRPKSSFPKGLIILLVGSVGIYGFIHFFSNWNTSDVSGIVKQVQSHLPVSWQQKLQHEMRANPVASRVQRQTAAVQTIQKVNKATSPSSQANNPYVEIDGHLYRKTPDNIYIINGRRVFYVDNRTER